jgi:hypothetical protein
MEPHNVEARAQRVQGVAGSATAWLLRALAEGAALALFTPPPPRQDKECQ